MQFNIREWRRIYDKVNGLGKMIKDSYPFVDEHGQNQPAPSPLSRETRNILADEIKALTERSNSYLDACGMKPPAPKWIYNNKDVTTWPSDPSFKYGHLL